MKILGWDFHINVLVEILDMRHDRSPSNSGPCKRSEERSMALYHLPALTQIENGASYFLHP